MAEDGNLRHISEPNLTNRKPNRVEDVKPNGKNVKLERALLPDKPLHRASDSLLSSSSGFDNYRGVLNLCIVLLVLSNGRMALENIIKYGVLVDPLQWVMFMFQGSFYFPVLVFLLLANVFILSAYKLELMLAKGSIQERKAFWIHAVQRALELILPAVFVHFQEIQLAVSSFALGMYSALFLKLISYTSVNRWCRKARSESIVQLAAEANGQPRFNLVVYPDNLNLKDLYYFIIAPSLCYELNFPRTTRVRKRFLINRVLEMLFLVQLMLGLMQQWMAPTIRNSMTPFQAMDYSRMLERLLKLAIPNHFIWLIFFYWFFHSSMNFMAEILRFADREFYRDWWNSETVQYFWQNWNIPVHRWAVRHLYLPLLKVGVSKQRASIAVFLVSAFFHEYLVSVPLKMFRYWAFMGMAMQIPFAWVVDRFLSGKYSNMAVWLCLIIGQPLAILMYYHDFYVLNVRK